MRTPARRPPNGPTRLFRAVGELCQIDDCAFAFAGCDNGQVVCGPANVCSTAAARTGAADAEIRELPGDGTCPGGQPRRDNTCCLIGLVCVAGLNVCV